MFNNTAKKLNVHVYYIPEKNNHSRYMYMFLKMHLEMGEITVAYATQLREKIQKTVRLTLDHIT